MQVRVRAAAAACASVPLLLTLTSRSPPALAQALQHGSGGQAASLALQRPRQPHARQRPPRAAASAQQQQAARLASRCRHQQPRSSSRRLAAAASAQQQQASLPGAVADAHPEALAACCECVTAALGVPADVAETYVQRAFGWGAKARAFWRTEKRDAPPDAQQVAAALAFLQEQVGLSGGDLAAAVKGCPELLGCSVERQLAANKARLQAEWKLDGAVLAGFVRRNPAVLAYNLDCGGDCAGECNRCWARA